MIQLCFFATLVFCNAKTAVSVVFFSQLYSHSLSQEERLNAEIKEYGAKRRLPSSPGSDLPEDRGVRPCLLVQLGSAPASHDPAKG